MSDLYDDDVSAWSERQAALLRRRAMGERVNDQIDWDNVVEEIESVGRSERAARGVARQHPAGTRCGRGTAGSQPQPAADR